MFSSYKTRFVALIAILFAGFTLVSVDFAEARRGGSFGSRGTRTFQTAPPTRTAPNPSGPVERSMTPNTGTSNPAASQNPAAAQQRTTSPVGGLFGGMGGLMRGVLIGGLFGMLLGYGFGGMAGMLGFALQLLLLVFLGTLFMGWLRSRNAPATAGGPQAANSFRRDAMARDAASQNNSSAGAFTVPKIGGGNAAPQPLESEDIRVDQTDLDTFERLLTEVQEAFSREDNAALRKLSTPEMVSYFSEELAENAKRGVQNDARETRLVEADISESWREGNEDYATAAFRYESVDVMRDRNTGAIVEGEDRPTETVELWTFVRRHGEDWKLSAIQEA
jgi:predicted lipid-binding transport protein (Tim44 family)